jgi:hypothetical protein
MACFLAPMTEAVVVSIIKKGTEKKESAEGIEKSRSAFSTKLGWLSKMLWGGSLLLAVEHVWHGEVVPWFPFLTAMNNPADIKPMLHEIATTGVSMALLVTAVWCVMLAAAKYMESRTSTQTER